MVTAPRIALHIINQVRLLGMDSVSSYHVSNSLIKLTPISYINLFLYRYAIRYKARKMTLANVRVIFHVLKKPAHLYTAPLSLRSYCPAHFYPNHSLFLLPKALQCFLYKNNF